MRTIIPSSWLRNLGMCMLALGALAFVSAAVSPQEQEKPQQQENNRRKWTRNNWKRRRRRSSPKGRRSEKQGDLAGANDKYVDAEGIYSTHEALNGIKRIHEAEDQKVTEPR